MSLGTLDWGSKEGRAPRQRNEKSMSSERSLVPVEMTGAYRGPAVHSHRAKVPRVSGELHRSVEPNSRTQAALLPKEPRQPRQPGPKW